MGEIEYDIRIVSSVLLMIRAEIRAFVKLRVV